MFQIATKKSMILTAFSIFGPKMKDLGHSETYTWVFDCTKPELNVVDAMSQATGVDVVRSKS